MRLPITFHVSAAPRRCWIRVLLMQTGNIGRRAHTSPRLPPDALWRGRRGRNSEQEPCSASRALHRRDLTAMRIHDRPAKREPQAGASGAGIITTPLELGE